MINYSFPTISNTKATVLILGTMPGVHSLAENQYYAHPRNAFWKIMFTLFNMSFSTDYEQRKKLLLQNGIALWDVLEACERKGSLDSAIKQEIANDFASFFKQHPHITHLFFNGQKAAVFFKKYVSLEQDYQLVTLPSTSPANAAKSFEKKLEEWQVIKP